MTDDEHRTLCNAASQYISMGLPVIALSGKAPNGVVHPHGLTEPFQGDTEPAHVVTGFYNPRTTGVGIVIPFPYLVVDIDGEEGAHAWKNLVGDADYTPDRWVAKTGRGLHLWYSSTTPTGNGRLGPKLDLKGQGGYVAAPPSKHPDGHRYTWLAEPEFDWPPMIAPPGLERWLEIREADRARSAISKDAMPKLHRRAYEDGTLYATTDWTKLVEGMEKADDGNRNNYLHWAARVMAEEWGAEDDFQHLSDAAAAAGLPQREVDMTIRSAVKAAGR